MAAVTATGGSEAASGRDETLLARTTMRRVSLRLLPFLFVLYICNFLDRTNVGIAALQMNRDLHFSSAAYGLGAGIFFIGYALCEVPSNLMLARVGARRWIARIMITWGIIAGTMMFVRTPLHFYLLRFFLGVAEAGFFPGVIYYMSQWFPAPERARAIARFMIAIPLSAALGSPLGGWLLGFEGQLGLHGWQWLYLVEGIPSVLLGFTVLARLTDRPEEARWLTREQRSWLTARLERDRDECPAPHGVPPWRALAQPVLWLLSLPYFLMLTASYSYSFWAPIVIRDALQASAVATGIITGAMACVAAVAMLMMGASADRRGHHCAHAAACAALISLGYVGAALVPNPIGRVASLVLVAVGTAAFLAPFWCLPSMLLRGTAAAAGIALVNSVGNVGGFVGPWVVGLLRDSTGGTTGSFVGLAALALVAAGFFLALGRVKAFAAPTLLSARPALSFSPRAHDPS